MHGNDAHMLKSDKPANQMLCICAQSWRHWTASKFLKQLITCYYQVINIFYAPGDSAWVKLSILLFERHEHAETLVNVSQACTVSPILIQINEYTNEFNYGQPQNFSFN